MFRTEKRTGPKPLLTQNEMITIVIFFHHLCVRIFKDYYAIYVKGINQKAFPTAPIYNRFVENMKQCLMPLHVFMTYCRLGAVTGISFVDSTSIFAARGKTSTSWFYRSNVICDQIILLLVFDNSELTFILRQKISL